MTANTYRSLVIVGVFAGGQLAARLPNTTAGFVCGLCVSFLVGLYGRRLYDAVQDERGAE